MEKDHLLATAVYLFRDQFGSDPSVAAFAPGRVNLIGEHTDYNDGFVLPFALPYRTVIVGAKAQNTTVSTIISNARGISKALFEANSRLSKGNPEWADYVKGTVYQYLREIPGGAAFNAVIVSNVPIGSGLSSSAALEVATATFLENLYGIRSVDGVTKALRCQKAEHTFAGMPCGIMDQYISAMGKKGNLLLIDCRSHGYTLVPYGSGADSPIILVTNSNVKHQLTGSEYPDRVKQCKEAVRILKESYPEVNALRDADMGMLENVKEMMSDLVYRRARHCISEDQRTLAAVEALKEKDYKKVGELMTESHRSLQHDYEVSCPELDFLVDVALTVPGVYGSRITGGGFGGCSVTLVERHAVKDLEEELKKRYRTELRLPCDCYECLPEEGSGALDLSYHHRMQAVPGEPDEFTKWVHWGAGITLAAAATGVVVLMVMMRNSSRK